MISYKLHEKSEIELEIAVCMKRLYISNVLQTGYDPTKISICYLLKKKKFSLVINS